MTYTLSQLAHSKLMPESVAAAIVAGNIPPVQELMDHLLTTSLDAYFVIAGDPNSSWNDKRLSHQSLVSTFMLALLLDGTFDPDHGGTATTATQEITI